MFSISAAKASSATACRSFHSRSSFSAAGPGSGRSVHPPAPSRTDASSAPSPPAPPARSRSAERPPAPAPPGCPRKTSPDASLYKSPAHSPPAARDSRRCQCACDSLWKNSSSSRSVTSAMPCSASIAFTASWYGHSRSQVNSFSARSAGRVSSGLRRSGTSASCSRRSLSSSRAFASRASRAFRSRGFSPGISTSPRIGIRTPFERCGNHCTADPTTPLLPATPTPPSAAPRNAVQGPDTLSLSARPGHPAETKVAGVGPTPVAATQSRLSQGRLRPAIHKPARRPSRQFRKTQPRNPARRGANRRAQTLSLPPHASGDPAGTQGSRRRPDAGRGHKSRISQTRSAPRSQARPRLF